MQNFFVIGRPMLFNSMDGSSTVVLYPQVGQRGNSGESISTIFLPNFSKNLFNSFNNQEAGIDMFII